MIMENAMFELKVREVIADTLDIELERVIDTADIIDDLGADSIQVLDLIVALENEFKISISDAEVINNRVVEDIIAFVLSK